MIFKILVGGYTDSVSILSFDPDSSPPTLKIDSITKVGKGPSWVGKHPKRSDLAIATLEGLQGKLVLLKVKPNGEAEVIQTVPTHGADPCHIEWLEDQVVSANYSGSNITSISFTSSHLLDEASTSTLSFEGSGPCIARQEKSHPHQAYFYSETEELLVPDLGADKIWRLVKVGGMWTVKGAVDFERGHGPRHLLVHDGILYTIGELTATLHAHILSPLPSSPTLLKYIDTLDTPLPPGNLEYLPAEILISPPSPISPPLLYVSNRNEPHPEGDAIAIYTPSSKASDTPFAKVGRFRTGLKNLRGIMFSPDGKYLIAGGSVEGGIKIFERLAGGLNFKEVALLQGEGAEKATSFVWL